MKAFNTVFAQHMDSGKLGEQRLANARLLEPLAYFNIQLGYGLGMGTQIGFKLLHGRSGA